MRYFRASFLIALCGFTTLLVFDQPRRAHAYVEVAHSFGQIVNLSSGIVLMRVTSVDRQKNAIIFAKVKDLKGTHKQTEFKHNIGQAGFEPREWKSVMAWADVGKEAVFFHNGGASETCIGTYWYQAYGNINDVNGWWGMSHAEPYLSRSFAGRIDKLVSAVTEIQTGKEVIVPCMVDGNLEALKAQKARIQRMKASLKLLDYNAKRDFVGWGGEDFRRVQGMPGFTHISSLSRVDPDSQSISAVDFDGDGKQDLCLAGAGRVALLKNDGEALGEVSLPNAIGSRSAVWADYNGDGLPDLLMATQSGPKLYTNLSKGSFRDDTHLLPKEAGYNLTCAAWIDQDGDGKPDMLLGNGWYGLRLYRNKGKLDVEPELALSDWHYAGPFSSEFNKDHGPEKGVDLKATYKGKNNAEVKWQKKEFRDGEVNSLMLFQDNNNASVYLHREITCKNAMKLPVSFGSDDGLVVWINGKKIISDNQQRGAAPDQNRATLELKAGKNELLIKVVQGGGDWAYYFKAGAEGPPLMNWSFVDASDAVNLSEKGIGNGKKGDTLTVFDLDGDGKQDFIYGANGGIVVKNTGKGFEVVKESGLVYETGKVGPVFGDFNGDGKPDLFVPQTKGCKLFRNDGDFKFTDITKDAGLDKIGAITTSAAWGDMDNDGHVDLVVGCMKEPNRYFRNKGDGKFEDCTEKLGLHTKVFNTQAVCLIDLNADGALDVVFNNEGQDPVVLLADAQALTSKRTPVSLAWSSKSGVMGGRVRVLDGDGKLAGYHTVSGGDGRGGQASPVARFALTPGKYQIEAMLSSGEKRSRELVVASNHVRGTVE